MGTAPAGALDLAIGVHAGVKAGATACSDLNMLSPGAGDWLGTCCSIQQLQLTVSVLHKDSRGLHVPAHASHADNGFFWPLHVCYRGLHHCHTPGSAGDCNRGKETGAFPLTSLLPHRIPVAMASFSAMAHTWQLAAVFSLNHYCLALKASYNGSSARKHLNRCMPKLNRDRLTYKPHMM